MCTKRLESAGVERIIISLPKDLLEKLNRLAQRKGLTRASYLRMVLTEHVAEEARREQDREP